MDFFTRWEQAISNKLSPQPQAYSRLTRTPIYVQDLPKGQAGAYDAPTDSMTLGPRQWNALQSPSNPAIPPSGANAQDLIGHESAHSIYDKSGMSSNAAQLVNTVPEGKRNLINALPLYNQQPGGGSDEQLTNEGLAYSIGDKSFGAPAYVEKAAQSIEAKHPQAAALLRRLNSNALASQHAKDAQ
jgi:hypothetical protein